MTREEWSFTICGGCGRYSVLCDFDPLPCVGCTCPNDWRRYVLSCRRAALAKAGGSTALTRKEGQDG